MYASEMLIEEVLLTPSPNLQCIGRSIEQILDGREFFAPVLQQLIWSFPQFVSNYRRPFSPFPTEQSAYILALATQEKLDADATADLRARKELGENNWDSTHAVGRIELQATIGGNSRGLDAMTWLDFMLHSQFMHELAVGAFPPDEQPIIESRFAEFIGWHSVCRAYMELLLLAIRRHGILPESESSRKGPKWHDIEHGAYVSMVDVFVTNDARFRRALEEHRACRADATWQVLDLNSWIETLRA